MGLAISGESRKYVTSNDKENVLDLLVVRTIISSLYKKTEIIRKIDVPPNKWFHFGCSSKKKRDIFPSKS